MGAVRLEMPREAAKASNVGVGHHFNSEPWAEGCPLVKFILIQKLLCVFDNEIMSEFIRAWHSNRY